MCCVVERMCVCVCADGMDLYQNSFIFDTHTSLATTNQKASLAVYMLSRHRVQSINRYIKQCMNRSIDRSQSHVEWGLSESSATGPIDE